MFLGLIGGCLGLIGGVFGHMFGGGFAIACVLGGYLGVLGSRWGWYDMDFGFGVLICVDWVVGFWLVVWFEFVGFGVVLFGVGVLLLFEGVCFWVSFSVGCWVGEFVVCCFNLGVFGCVFGWLVGVFLGLWFWWLFVVGLLWICFLGVLMQNVFCFWFEFSWFELV